MNHGLFPKLGSCLLAIDAYTEEDTLVIAISDNGIGIPQPKLAQLTAGESEGVGITNVNKRLISLFGPKYGLSITSDPPCGTEIRLHIPFSPKR